MPINPLAKPLRVATFLRSSWRSERDKSATILRRWAGVRLLDMLLLINLADHFHNGDEGSFAIAPKQGVPVGQIDNDGEVVSDGFFVAEPFFGRGGILFGNALFQAHASEGELMLAFVMRHEAVHCQTG